MSRKEKLYIGINQDLEEKIVEIPDADPRPWDGKDKLTFIGNRVPRVDGVYKTSGKAKYTFDVKVPGMIYGKIIRSPYPAAIVKKIDISKAKNLKGIKAIFPVQDELPFPVRFAGQEVVALAAESEYIAEQAVKLIEIKYEEQPFVVDLDKAMQDDAPVVYKDMGEDKDKQKNVQSPRISPRDGNSENVDHALKTSEHVVTQTYRTQVQTHCPMETHGVIAKWEHGKITVWASTQAIFRVRDQVADHFKIPKSQVQVITKFMGGGFGSKLSAGIYTILAVKLAREAKMPVRLMLSRKEDQLATGNRPNSIQKLSIGADKKGKITGIKLISYGTAGVGRGAGTSGPAKYIYDVENIYTEEYDVHTNAGPSVPFRAPGHPQGVFALEQAIDEMAYKIGLDPLEFRKINSGKDKVRQVEYQLGADKADWSKRNPKAGADQGIIKKGIGVANSLWYYIYVVGSHVSLRVNDDGSVHLRSGVQDIGGGITTPMAMIVAEELGLKPADIRITNGDSDFGYAPSSGGSQTTSGLTPAVRNAAHAAKQRLKEIAAKEWKVTIDDVLFKAGDFYTEKDPMQKVSFKELSKEIPRGEFTVVGDRREDYYKTERFKISGVQFAEVEVDTGTGSIKVERIVAVHDCGRPMNRLTIDSQMNGGIIQGISYALYEDRILDRNTGVMVNPNLESYKIAGAMEVPKIESHIIDLNLSQSSTGAIGIGEPATIPTSAAIANAVYHAIGVRINELPMTPAKVLAALNKV